MDFVSWLFALVAPAGLLPQTKPAPAPAPAKMRVPAPSTATATAATATPAALPVDAGTDGDDTLPPRAAAPAAANDGADRTTAPLMAVPVSTTPAAGALPQPVPSFVPPQPPPPPQPVPPPPIVAPWQPQDPSVFLLYAAPGINVDNLRTSRYFQNLQDTGYGVASFSGGSNTLWVVTAPDGSQRGYWNHNTFAPGGDWEAVAVADANGGAASPGKPLKIVHADGRAEFF